MLRLALPVEGALRFTPHLASNNRSPSVIANPHGRGSRLLNAAAMSLLQFPDVTRAIRRLRSNDERSYLDRPADATGKAADAERMKNVG